MSGPAQGTNLQNVTGVIENILLVTSGFHAQKNLSENYLQFGHVPTDNFTSPVPG
jgi:hypothetical protein